MTSSDPKDGEGGVPGSKFNPTHSRGPGGEWEALPEPEPTTDAERVARVLQALAENVDSAPGLLSLSTIRALLGVDSHMLSEAARQLRPGWNERQIEYYRVCERESGEALLILAASSGDRSREMFPLGQTLYNTARRLRLLYEAQLHPLQTIAELEKEYAATLAALGEYNHD